MTSRPVPEGQYAELPNGHRIHYLTEGLGKETVVFLHGSGSGACAYSNFKHNYPALVDKSYRALMPDLIGYGYSDKPDDIDYTLDIFIECVVQLMDKLRLSAVTLVGNSLGGAIALGLTLKHPERVNKLILMAPGGVEEQADYFHMPGMALMKQVFTSGEPITPDGMKDFFRKAFVVNPDCVDDELVNERHALMQMQNPRVIQTMRVPNMTERLGEIKCPTLCFWGLDEQMMPESGIMKLAKGIPHLRMILVPQCGHWVMIEHPDLFNRMTLDFLENG